MHNGGFLDNRKSNPLGLGLVIAGHVAVLTAIALAPPEAIQKIIYPPTIINSIPEEAPPPPPPMPRAQPEHSAQQPTTTDSIVKTSDPGPIVIVPQPPLTPPVAPPLTPLAADPVTMPATMDPSAMGRFQPDYPSDLVRAEIEGSATVRVLIGSDGRVKSVDLVNATQPGFFEATRKQALRYWRFKPATRDGVAVESWRTMTVRFTLQG